MTTAFACALLLIAPLPAQKAKADDNTYPGLYKPMGEVHLDLARLKLAFHRDFDPLAKRYGEGGIQSGPLVPKLKLGWKMVGMADRACREARQLEGAFKTAYFQAPTEGRDVYRDEFFRQLMPLYREQFSSRMMFYLVILGHHWPGEDKKACSFAYSCLKGVSEVCGFKNDIDVLLEKRVAPVMVVFTDRWPWRYLMPR